MKRNLIITFALLLTIVIIAPNSYASEYEPTPTEIARQYGYPNVTDAYQPEGSINVSQTGQILYDYQSNQKWYPASMTKLMTMYLTLEAVNKGELSLNDKVHITDKHYRMSTLPELSNTKLYAGETYTISELLQITVSNSSNAAALILADEVSGNVNDFTDLMNKKAKALDMSNTHFVNPTGAENKQLKEFAPSKYKNQDNTTSTAKDFAILDQHIIKETPKILHFTKQLAPTQHGVTYYTFNHSLEGAKMSLPGTDGFKTGSSDVADYNHTITTKRNNFRINQVIMGAGDYVNLGGEKQRNMMGNAMMNSSFDQYSYKKVLSKGTHKINGKKYYVKDNLYDVVPEGMNKKDYKFIVKDGSIHLDYNRQFLTKDDRPPKVEVTKPLLHKANTIAQTTWKEHPVVTFVALALLAIAFILIVRSIIHLLFKRK
ncbi:MULTISPECIES: penicillin-binding protein PBP4 [Staphylococcus]|uniref:penicillin-binding protein PBP4 n=1 Tax=Staphylococcus TaxID=1279 RepID=UPI00069F70A9|nr:MULTISPECIES: penicillin-binding protein PBP4 [Staphylococcus]MBY6180243.1 penicillin-binding protein PBP4 [Staphylococcaceae bacterium DP2N0-1]MCH4381357.1 penicillin-binding protein PBP4 [Staphylococcus haemolyticus]MCH4388821.1 penicillin-binding protein PBP4 [Staphylococcus haemolyticus]MCH4517904.1 penicillin-binding protein PBP4 [Staphylococcus haemolyticus]MCH4534235.1 penicillin-binding protein PBP4 [Staphylococcus haemolyticus]